MGRGAVEPFFLDLSQLDAVDRTILHGDDADLTRWVSGVAADTFAGSTVLSIVLTVPVGTGKLRAEQQIATWCAAKLATDAGGWRQVGRTGLPMIWPLFRDAGTEAASHANETHPADDRPNFLPLSGFWRTRYFRPLPTRLRDGLASIGCCSACAHG